MKRLLFSCLLLLLGYNSYCQPLKYTTANVHSHNDYEQATPFWLAYNEGFGSMEADIFLQDDELLVAHEKKELVNHRTLEEYYLHNLQQCIEKNGGHPYSDASRKLQLLIDIKTEAIITIAKLIEVLRKYPTLINNHSITFVITGNRPEAVTFGSYPPFIYFDGELSKTYSNEAMKKIVLLSDNFKTYSRWNGEGVINEAELNLLRLTIDKAHQFKKPVRFWNAPDFENAWGQFMRLNVDYINTDHIKEISSFLKRLD